MKSSVKVCVIPAAGTGTRWAPLSDHIPKEMLPIDGTPVIEHVAKEAADSGIEEIVIVINDSKSVIEKYMQNLDWLKKKAELHFIYLNNSKSPGESILSTQKYVKGRPFAMCWPDMPSLYTRVPTLKKLINKYNNKLGATHLIAFADYPKNNMLYYGECKVREFKKHLYSVKHVCPRAKKPGESHHAGNKLRIAGRYVFGPDTFTLIKNCMVDWPDVEVHDGHIITKIIQLGQKVIGVKITDFILDTGMPELYMKSNAVVLKKNKKREYLRRRS